MIRLLMAVSKDGFISRGQDDDLRWLGKQDKEIFKMFTFTAPLCVVGRKTFESMPDLNHGVGKKQSDFVKGGTYPARQMFVITNHDDEIYEVVEGRTDFYGAGTLDQFQDLYQTTKLKEWTLLGGQELAKSMIEANLVDESYICYSDRWCFDGIEYELEELLIPKIKHRAQFKIGDIKVEWTKLK